MDLLNQIDSLIKINGGYFESNLRLLITYGRLIKFNRTKNYLNQSLSTKNYNKNLIQA